MQGVLDRSHRADIKCRWFDSHLALMTFNEGYVNLHTTFIEEQSLKLSFPPGSLLQAPSNRLTMLVIAMVLKAPAVVKLQVMLRPDD